MNRTTKLIVPLFILAIFALGCRFLGSSDTAPTGNSTPTPSTNSNRSLTDKAIDSTVGRSNVGIPECDRVLEAIEVELNNPDDNYVVKAAKAAVLNQIKDSIRKELEQNTNKSDVASACKEFQEQLVKFKADQQSNKQ